MLIWLDLLTPKQVYFLGELGRRLEERGHGVFRTTRRYKEVNELIKIKNIIALSIGRHGGPSLEGKLLASVNRIRRLSKIISKLNPDLSLAFASPEAARTAFGLAIPHYTVNDSPHSTHVARLTIPLASKIFSPSIISKEVWMRLGANLKRVIQYNALDPVAWLKSFRPNPAILTELQLNVAKPIIVIRVEEAFASYLLGQVSESESITIPIINEILENEDPPQIVVLPRYLEQIQTLQAIFEKRVIIPSKVIDGPSLLFFASIFVGAGGTMTTESALLGTPTISCFPRKPTIVEQYLIKKKLVYRQNETKTIVKKIYQILGDMENYRKKQRQQARNLTTRMEDPIEVIVKEIEKQ